MHKRYLILVSIFLTLSLALFAQEQGKISIRFIKNHETTLPGRVINLAFQVQNESNEVVSISPEAFLPESWVLVTQPRVLSLKPGSKQLALLSVKSGFSDPVQAYELKILAIQTNTKDVLDSASILINVLEIEDVSLQLVERSTHVLAGENIQATYLVQNKGNTEKELYLNASNCDVVGSPVLTLQPGESQQIQITKSTSSESYESRDESYTVRIQIGDSVLQSVYASTLVLPSQKAKRDVYFRFPVKASATYLATNRNSIYEAAYQFQIEGNGTLDPEGKHQLSFLARWPNNNDLSFMGLYDQYYAFYSNKNFGVFVGEKSFEVTPLTENARYGRGVETSVTLNSGFNVGFAYVKPRFYEDIESEISASTGYNFNKDNTISFHYLSKNYHLASNPAQLVSLAAEFNPFERTNLELEVSRGNFNGKASNAYRAGLNSQFSIFQVSGIYYDAGKYYPGYYTNSKFYSANINARLSEKLSLAFNGREDFTNAQLDTFFVIAPYSRLLQTSVSYRIIKDGSVRLFYRQNERKDRLSLEKFHYQTNSWNLQWSQRYRRFDYSLNGELGETTNFLLSENNVQNSYRAAVDINYRFNSKHSVRMFGTWSNINEFVSNDQRKITAGISATSNLSKNLRVNFYLQNAYDIEEYYRNRNLLQFNLNYTFLKHHSIALRSFYTIFKTEADPEFTASLTYSYNLGIPLKQVVSGGEIAGQVVDQNGAPVEDVYLRVLSETTISDKNGDYRFKLVPPGRQMLLINKEKLSLDEVTNIPIPLEVDVIDNETTTINIQILKGCKISGRIELEKASLNALNDENASPGNIVVELNSDFESYRIATDRNGNFSFPLVRPGNVELKIYSNTIPTGYALSQSNYNWNLKAGEEKEVIITLESKKKNIIFKPSGNILSVGKTLSTSSSVKTIKANNNDSTEYYSVQIGAYHNPLPENTTVLADEPFYFEKQIDNFHKYFIGKFNTQSEAENELKRLKQKFQHAFIVVWKGDEVMSLEEYNRENKNEEKK